MVFAQSPPYLTVTSYDDINAMYNYKIRRFPDGTEQHIVYLTTVKSHASKKVTDKTSNSDSIVRKEIDNQKRARSEVFDLCRSNQFDYFVTLTFDPDIVDSFDYDASVDALRKFTRWLTNNDCKYVLVPEQHKSGRWHFHGLVKGKLLLVPSINAHNGQVIPDLYNISNYKFGFSTASFIKDRARVSTYVTKYLSKALLVPKGRKRYWCSSGLLRPSEETKEIAYHPLNELRSCCSFEKHIKSDYCELYFFEIQK